MHCPDTVYPAVSGVFLRFGGAQLGQTAARSLAGTWGFLGVILCDKRAWQTYSGAMKHAFADFVVDTDTRELWSGHDQVALEPKGFDLLVYLIANCDRVVSKDELVEEIW